jgi:PPP family 3-phenylpropionic acid transporter
VVAGLLAATQAPQTPLTDALAMHTLGQGRLREYGSFRLWASAGWGVGAIAFGALLQLAGLGWMLPIYAAGLVCCAIYVRLFANVRPGPGATSTSRFGSLGEALTQVPRLPLFLFGVFLFGASTRASWDYVPLQIASGGGGAFLVGVAAGVSAFIEIPLMRSSGSLMERFGMRVVFIAGAAVYALASLGWAIVQAPLGVTAIRISIGVGFGLVYVTLVVMTGTLVPERLRNTGQMLLTVSSWGLAPVLGSLVGGLVYQHLGPTKLFLGSALGIAIGATIVWLATSGLRAPPSDDGRAAIPEPPPS